ncbi:MAG: ribonuclease HI [Clostridia bacterium]|nr:ribonuclease HI [Clostridia bacterium]
MIESNPDKSIDELINAVCSKGGTTVEAIKVFDENDLSGIVYKAVSACVNRSDEIESGEKIVEIYTDGACSGNPGAGGYCAILVFGGTEKIVKGYEPDTTNNRMELVAAIEGISSLKESCRIKLYSDSSYLINAFNNGWVFDWKENGWKTAGKAEVKNIDLWEKLLSLYGKHKISFIKVKGHADNDYNNRCDKIAVNEYLSRLS